MIPTLNENAITVLEKRYLAKDENGIIIETPSQMFRRVAQAIAGADRRFDKSADIESSADKFYRLMSSLRFLPNSPTLMNAGRPLGQLAACFVLPIEDSMDSIFEALKQAAIIHKSGGGTGFSFSRIRPAEDVVSSTAGVSSGPVSFMGVFDTATETVKQGGTRRGANMAVLRVDHPDIEKFITAKNRTDKLSNFNISVAITDRFMEALTAETRYDLINPRTQKTVRRVSAQSIFDLIVESAWRTGEPGLIFIDKINRENPVDHLGAIEATNPCGEQPLLPFESCTLGSINLSAMVDQGVLQQDRLTQTVEEAVHFLDNVIEINRYPLTEVEKQSKATRKIGLGVMGFADMLIKLGIPYDSKDAIDAGKSVMGLITREARDASAVLGKKRGSFPAYPKSRWDTPQTPSMRNATTTTIAPTGSISLIAGVSSGIEPLFAVVHGRTVLDGKTLIQTHPLFLEMAKSMGFYSPQLLEEIAKTGQIEDTQTEVPDSVKQLFRTSHDIDPKWHVAVQAAFQEHTDNAVSKTVNFRADATRQEVETAFMEAYRRGCKGITIYRYGSRDQQVLNLGKTGQNDSRVIAPRPRPQRTRGVTERIQTGCGKLYVTINSDDQGLCEVFAQMGKTGGCASSQIEAAGRLISLALRSGIQLEAVIKQLTGIRCPSPAWQNGQMVLSCPDAMARVLKQLLDVSGQTPDTVANMIGLCPSCNDVLIHEEGCLLCHGCGYSKCGG
jgi:ribonucleoside-diphosphate reductase alpha chain